MVGTSSALVGLRVLRGQSTPRARGLFSSAIVQQEASSKPSSSSNSSPKLNPVAALRKKLGDQRSRGNEGGQQRRQQEDRPNRSERSRSASGSQGAADRPPRRDGQGRPARPNNSRQGQRGGKGGGQAPARSDRQREDSAPVLNPTPVQSIYPGTEWQKAADSVSLGYNRVPYAIPLITLENMNKEVVKNASPLKQAGKALKLHLTSRETIMGPVQEPTPIARVRAKVDDAPKIEQSETSSIANETKESRIRQMKEKFGGDYQRWEKGEIIKVLNRNSKSDLVENHAAEALVRNDDLGPLLKTWTLNTVKTILQGNRPA